MANVHPWFGNISIDGAAAWTAEFFQNNDVILATNLTNKPTMYIAETGWPTVIFTFLHWWLEDSLLTMCVVSFRNHRM